jgi:hypothetical protein
VVTPLVVVGYLLAGKLFRRNKTKGAAVTVAVDDAIEGVVAKPITQQIKEAWDSADVSEDEADKAYWLTAKMIVDALASGMKQTELAEEVGRSQSLISKYAKVYKNHMGLPGRKPRFRDAYREVNGENKPASVAKKDKPKEVKAKEESARDSVADEPEPDDTSPVPSPTFLPPAEGPVSAVPALTDVDTGRLPQPGMLAKKIYDESPAYAINLRDALQEVIDQAA